MKYAWWFAAACLLLNACATPGTPAQVVTPMPTPCATTVVAQSGGTAAVPTQNSGHSNPATPLPGMPTLSPELQATRLAQMQNANPGAPTTPSGPPGASAPACPTPTPAK